MREVLIARGSIPPAVQARAMPLYTVLANTSDYPGRFVVRERRILPDITYVIDPPRAIAPTLELARDAVPPGCVRFERDPSDDPAIVESWI